MMAMRLAVTMALLSLAFSGCAPKQEDDGSKAPTAKVAPAPAEEPSERPPAGPAVAPAAPAAAPAEATPEAAQPAPEAAPEKPLEPAPEVPPVVAPAPAEAVAPALAFDLLKVVAAADRYLPDDLLILAAADLSVLEEMVLPLVPVELLGISEATRRKMIEEVTAFHLRKLGFAVTDVTGAVLFVSGGGDGGILLQAKVEYGAALEELPLVAGHRQMPLPLDPGMTAFFIPDYGLGLFAAGKESTVEAYLQAATERTGGGNRFERLTSEMAADKSGWFVAVVDFAHRMVAENWPPDLPVARPDRLTMALTTHGLTITVDGSQECLDNLASYVELGRSQAKAMLAMARAGLEQLSVPEGTMVIIGDTIFDDLFAAVAPKRTGNRMTMEMNLQLAGVVPIVGVLAAVAVPAFLKYIRKAKTSEVLENVERIKRGAEDYFSTPRVDETGTKMPCHFPPAATVPPEGTCCASFGGPDGDGDDACDADASRFNLETWSALKFQLEDKHFFAYEFRPNGLTGAEAAFEVIAYGDLDCDGIRSTFVATGKGVVSEGGGECSVEFPEPRLSVENEEE